MVKTYCFDIDGTLCHTEGSNYKDSTAKLTRIALVNKLYDEGNRIILFTARGSTTGIDWHELTFSQVNSWGIKFHELKLGKPSADIYIDDKGCNDCDFFVLEDQI